MTILIRQGIHLDKPVNPFSILNSARHPVFIIFEQVIEADIQGIGKFNHSL